MIKSLVYSRYNAFSYKADLRSLKAKIAKHHINALKWIVGTIGADPDLTWLKICYSN